MLRQIRDTRYYVSDDGKIYSKKRELRELGYINVHGYKRVVLYIDKKRTYFYVHMLVAEYFPELITDLTQPSTSRFDISVRFKDDDRSNCDASNLYLADRKQHPAMIYGYCPNCNTIQTHKHIYLCVRRETNVIY